MNEESELLFLKHQIRKDLLYIKKFCIQNNISPSYHNFLTYKTGQIPSCIYFFLGNDYCKYFFCSSKKYHSFFNFLPQDFKQDIGYPKKILLLLKTKPHIQEYLKTILKNDYTEVI
jgi:hypothetical protein